MPTDLDEKWVMQEVCTQWILWFLDKGQKENKSREQLGEFDLFWFKPIKQMFNYVPWLGP